MTGPTFEVCDRPEDWERVRHHNSLLASLDRIVKAWDVLKHGDYTRDIVETWLAQEMKPAIEAARLALAPASCGGAAK